MPNYPSKYEPSFNTSDLQAFVDAVVGIRAEVKNYGKDPMADAFGSFLRNELGETPKGSIELKVESRQKNMENWKRYFSELQTKMIGWATTAQGVEGSTYSSPMDFPLYQKFSNALATAQSGLDKEINTTVEVLAWQEKAKNFLASHPNLETPNSIRKGVNTTRGPIGTAVDHYLLDHEGFPGFSEEVRSALLKLSRSNDAMLTAFNASNGMDVTMKDSAQESVQKLPAILDSAIAMKTDLEAVLKLDGVPQELKNVLIGQGGQLVNDINGFVDDYNALVEFVDPADKASLLRETVQGDFPQIVEDPVHVTTPREMVEGKLNSLQYTKDVHKEYVELLQDFKELVDGIADENPDFASPLEQNFVEIAQSSEKMNDIYTRSASTIQDSLSDRVPMLMDLRQTMANAAEQMAQVMQVVSDENIKAVLEGYCKQVLTFRDKVNEDLPELFNLGLPVNAYTYEGEKVTPEMAAGKSDTYEALMEKAKPAAEKQRAQMAENKIRREEAARKEAERKEAEKRARQAEAREKAAAKKAAESERKRVQKQKAAEKKKEQRKAEARQPEEQKAPVEERKQEEPIRKQEEVAEKLTGEAIDAATKAMAEGYSKANLSDGQQMLAANAVFAQNQLAHALLEGRDMNDPKMQDIIAGAALHTMRFNQFTEGGAQFDMARDKKLFDRQNILKSINNMKEQGMVAAVAEQLKGKNPMDIVKNGQKTIMSAIEKALGGVTVAKQENKPAKSAENAQKKAGGMGMGGKG